MPSPGWYLRRLRTMSPGEVAWRLGSALRVMELRGRLALGREPEAPAAPPIAATARPSFRLSDVSVGEWAHCTTEPERSWRDELCSRADRLAQHRLSFFDLEDCDLGDPIDWNRDHAAGRPTPLRFAPLIDYRDWNAVGDAKVVWEPSRHHQLVVLGRAYRGTGDARYARAVIEQLESWISQCPFGRGMNWRSPLELAIRLINWVWAVDLILESGLVTGACQNRVRRAAFQHLWLITRSYSRGSSANNHRIGEAAGVFVATSYFPDLDPSGQWRQESRQILEEEIVVQTYSDGGTREQATGYHVFVLQFCLVAGLVGRRAG